ncbi:MAG: glycoside-pentoside-hexuronide (GPH):cation symporter [Nibricoccus sp.]
MTKTSLATRFSYALPDIGGQLLFGWIMWYLPYFYANVYGLTAAAAGTIVFIARFVDAIDAPVWGVIFDRTNSRWGKSRPWFLWLCGPFALFGFLSFVTPDLSYNAKAVYAALTYIAVNVIYTGINTPVTSILSALTTSPQERVTLTTFRMVGSKLGVAIVNFTGIDLARRIGNGNDRKGFMIVLSAFAIISIGAFLLAFRNLKEVVRVEEKPRPITGSFRALQGNWPWFIIFASSFFFWIGFIARVTVAPFFFEGILNRPDLIKPAGLLDFASLATALLLPWTCRAVSKTGAWVIGLAGMIIGQVIVAFGTGQDASVLLIMTGWAVGFIFSGMAMAMPFSVLSESVDYGEWKTGVRAAGLLTAIGAAFCLKAGAGLGGAIPMWIMGAAGWKAKQALTVESAHAIMFCTIWLPAICLSLSLLPVLFYHRFEKMEPKIQEELNARRTADASVASKS